MIVSNEPDFLLFFFILSSDRDSDTSSSNRDEDLNSAERSEVNHNHSCYYNSNKIRAAVDWEV